MVETRRIHVVLLAAAITAITAIAAIAPAGHAQNATDWLANTYGTLAAHVGNTARSMWVAPEGVIYTASMWDEYEGGVAIYQNGKSVPCRSSRVARAVQPRNIIGNDRRADGSTVRKPSCLFRVSIPALGRARSMSSR
ncbi:SMP-30/gluconolaconase/LRE domain-containing protein [Burkholderia pseudomallei]|nr:SMP-30/gluconolaconase/LRE domain-containing protein [Burkholderia pseudomallei]